MCYGMFGDESVAMHLRDSDYGKMFIQLLWETLHFHVFLGIKIEISYVLGNAFI